MKKRGQLDGSKALVDFADNLEKASVRTIEEGVITGDLFELSAVKQKKVVDTETFLREFNERLLKMG